MPQAQKLDEMIPLPAVYDEMQEVDRVERNGRPDRLKHAPFTYVALDKNLDTYGVAVVVDHGLGAFYSCEEQSMETDPALIAYKSIMWAKDAGCMVHAFRDAGPVPTVVYTKVEHKGKSNSQPVRTAHADDMSKPPVLPTFQNPVPCCYVECDGKEAEIHCMLYLEAMGRVLDIEAVKESRFVPLKDPEGRLLEWRLEVPLADGEPPVLQYVAFKLDLSSGVASGDVVRLKVRTDPRSGGTGRSFAFIWP